MSNMIEQPKFAWSALVRARYYYYYDVATGEAVATVCDSVGSATAYIKNQFHGSQLFAGPEYISKAKKWVEGEVG